MDEKLYFVNWFEPTSSKWHKEYVMLSGYEVDRLLSFFEDNLGENYGVDAVDEEKQPLSGFDALAMKYGWGK